MKFFTAYDRPLDAGIDCSDMPSMTKQSFADECNINNIMAKFAKTGLLDFVNQNEPHYGEISPVDFQQAMNTVIAAQEMFDGLPGDLRQRFDDDPAKFLAFVEDPAKIDESIALGIRVKRVIQGTGEVSASSGGSTPPEPSAKAPIPPVDGSKGA
jgi:phage internal scaffolding protein